MSPNIQKEDIDKMVVKSVNPPVWGSPLCTTVFGLTFVIILLAISAILAVIYPNPLFIYIIPALSLVTIAILAFLLKQVLEN